MLCFVSIASVRNTHKLLKKKKEEARQELSHLSKSSWVAPRGSPLRVLT